MTPFPELVFSLLIFTQAAAPMYFLVNGDRKFFLRTSVASTTLTLAIIGFYFAPDNVFRYIVAGAALPPLEEAFQAKLSRWMND